MDEIRAELDSLEEDLEAFLRGRVEPALSRALEVRLDERSREIAAHVEARLKDAAVRSESAAAAQAQELRALREALGEVRRELARLNDRVTRLERRAPREEPRAIEAPPAMQSIQVYRREAPPAPVARPALVDLVSRNREYVAIGAVAAVVICLVVWAVFFFVGAPAKPPPPPPPVATSSQAAPVQKELVSADPVDAGLNELAARSESVRALCGQQPCAFAQIWPGMTDAGRRSLLLAASDLVVTRCAGALPATATSLAPAWRAAVACSRDASAPRLYGPRDYEPVARWLLAWIGAHP
jgi:uncharacterized coiled-coil protein SlyX